MVKLNTCVFISGKGTNLRRLILNSNKYKLLIPELDLNEPLSNLVKYIYKNFKNKNNIFDNLNKKITQTLEKI